MFGFVMLVFCFVTLAFYLRKAQSGWIPRIRTLPAVEAVREAVGRATEMGKPVYCCPGRGGVNAQYTAHTLAGLSVVNYAAEMCAEQGAPLVCLTSDSATYTLMREGVLNAFTKAGKREEFSETYCRYAPPGFSLQLAVMRIAEDEKPAAAILIGQMWNEAVFMIDNMRRIGAITIGGTEAEAYIFIGCVDYVLIADEMFNVEALLTGNPVQTSSVAAIDTWKALGLAIILIGTIALTLGSNIILDLLGT